MALVAHKYMPEQMPIEELRAFTEVFGAIKTNYVEPVEDKKLITEAINGMLTGLEANLRFGPVETINTRVFGRLSAWQNWIFIRPNAVGEAGALKVFGSGNKAKFNWERV